jgi:hypothetical protein
MAPEDALKEFRYLTENKKVIAGKQGFLKRRLEDVVNGYFSGDKGNADEKVKAGVDEIKDLIEKGKAAGYTKDRMRVLINTFNTGDKTKKEKIKQLFDRDAAKAGQPEVKEFVPENLGKSYKRYSGGGYTKPSNVMDYSPQPLLEQGVKKAKE